MKEQIIVISGGSRGLGGALAADLLARGHRVATFSRKSSPLIDDLKNQDPSGRAFYWEAIDGTDFDALRSFVLAAEKRFGRIDALINNAAMLLEGVLALTPRAEIHRALALNLESVIYLTQACVKAMLRNRSGKIISISSLNAIRGHRGISIYSAAKAALDGFTRSLARELGPTGILVNSVAPGYFESEMSGEMGEKQRQQIIRRTPAGRLGTTDDLVGVIRFLLSEDARFITGQTVVVDGGLTC